MPYFQASEILKNPESSISELLDALEDCGVQYGYLVAMAEHGLRDDVETELVRLLTLIKLIKIRIKKL